MTSKLEALMMDLGRDRAEVGYRRSLEKGQVGYIDRGRHMITSDTSKFADWIARWRLRCKTNYDDLQASEREVYDALTNYQAEGVDEALSIDTPDLAFLTVNFCYMQLGNTYKDAVSAMSVAARLGLQVQDEMVYTYLKAKEPELWKKSQRYTKKSSAYIQKQAASKAFRSKGYSTRLWSTVFRGHLGNWLLEAFRIATGHIYFKSIQTPGGWRSVVLLEKEVWDYVSRSTDDDIHYKPRLMPIEEPPVKWTGMRKGGYHDDGLVLNAVLASDDASWDFFKGKDLGLSVDAMTILQETEWALSPLARKTFNHYLDHRIDRAGLVESEPRELPEKVLGEDGKPTQESRRARAAVYGLNKENRSKRVSYKRCRQVADLLDGGFHYVVQSDGRGRLYYAGEFLNPQGGDYARGQLIFKKPMPVDDEALWWMKVNGANLAGQDKLPFEERVAWVDEHIDLIAAVAEDPLSTGEWEDFDEPFQFLSWAEDFVEALGTGLSRCPVALDGSNNGLQVFSLLLRDPDMARATNVVSVDRPNDIYQTVADRVWALLEKDTFDLSESGEHSRMWLDFLEAEYNGRVPRAISKRPVMTKCYSVSKFRVNDYISEWLVDNHPDAFKGVSLWKMAGHLGNFMWDAMEDMLDGAASGMRWLKDSAKQIVAETNQVPWWTSPSGFPVFRPYYKCELEQVRLVFGQQTNLRSVRGPHNTATPKTRQIVNGIAPNFIHSIDAAIAHRLAVRLKEMGVQDLRWVHDSFATHAAWAGVLSTTIREVVYEVCKEDLLANLKAEWEDRYKVDLPDLPSYGSLDPKEVLRAKYAYS